jgi:hypothetical protein
MAKTKTPASPADKLPVPIHLVERRIFSLRGHNVILSSHIAELYDVPTSALNQAVKRNRPRFPEDFMFQLTKTEFENLKSQIVISSWGGARALPYAFTQEGVAMLSSVLKSDRAVQVNIAIMRAFVQMKQFATTHKELAEKIAGMEKKYDSQFRVVFEAIKKLLEPPPAPSKPRIGFKPHSE